MKHLKMLGLAAVAATALMAFVGAGTASATVICKTEPSSGVCPEGWAYPAGTAGTASLVGSATLTSGVETVTCTESTVKSTLKEAGSATTTVKSGISTITWGGCNHTIDTLNGGSAELHWISGTNNGTLTTFNTEVTISIFGVSCVYGAPSTGLDVGTTVGGNPGSMEIQKAFPKLVGGIICPAEPVFEARYVATEPKNAWVAER